MKTTLGQLIHDKRTDAGLTQIEFAEAVGRSQKWVSDIERGVIKAMHLSLLKSAAAVLRIEPEELVLAAGMAGSLSGARKVVASAPDDDGEELPPHMRASFLKAGGLSPERQQLLKETIDTFYEADEAYREQIRRDVARRREEGILD